MCTNAVLLVGLRLFVEIDLWPNDVWNHAVCELLRGHPPILRVCRGRKNSAHAQQANHQGSEGTPQAGDEEAEALVAR